MMRNWQSLYENNNNNAKDECKRLEEKKIDKNEAKTIGEGGGKQQNRIRQKKKIQIQIEKLQ